MQYGTSNQAVGIGLASSPTTTTVTLQDDAAGNLIGQNGGVTNAYDAEGRLCAVLSATGGYTQYLYDAEGRRVAKGSGSMSCDPSSLTLTNTYILGLGGEQLTEITYTNGNATWLHSNAYARGTLLATYDNAGLHFHFTDWLGSRRMQASGTGLVEETCQSLPFGDMLNCNGPASDATEQHFTGKERDAESGLDYFGARYFGSSMGRMMSPDPLGGDLTNPQSLNRYAYALNNPLTNTDPTGLYVCKDGKDGACTSDQDKAFEKSLAGLRGSSNADVARAAGAYGAAGDKNGVTVGFADLGKSGEDGVTKSSLGADANGKLQAQSDVTINTGASGASYDAAVGHEGSHVADAQAVVSSIVVDSHGNFTVGNNITQYQSEQRAYGVTNAILSSEGVSATAACGVDPCKLGTGVMQMQVPGVADRIMNYGYTSGGKPMGPKNQGNSVVNGISITPKATVPQVPH